MSGGALSSATSLGMNRREGLTGERFLHTEDPLQGESGVAENIEKTVCLVASGGQGRTRKRMVGSFRSVAACSVRCSFAKRTSVDFDNYVAS